ncbi:MAG: hypothetical protein LR015_10010 [Verrucomicrobia bacterium]|nr:hypothetical protein [Verrucomicrobiota bacterium]
MLGWTRATKREHILRAALESIAFQVADGLRLFDDLNLPAAKTGSFKVSGAAAENLLLLQILADLTRCNVSRPDQQELSAWGVAALAGIQAGIWKNPGETAALWRENANIIPAIGADEAAGLHANWTAAKSRVWL